MKKLFVILVRSKIWIEILLMALMAYLFTHYLDGDIGVVVWSFFIIAPLLSVLLSYRACRKMTARLEAPDYLAKGKTFYVNLIAETEGKFPVPFVCCHIMSSSNLVQQDTRPIQSAMTAEEPLKISNQMTASYAGLGKVSIQELAVCDYLGLFKFLAWSVPDAVTIGVIPDIPELTNANMILHAVSDVILTQDDEEEESAVAFSAQSMPGYVHRDYVAGDSLKRINWKMSAKRQKLMVRMDEAVTTVRPTVILDVRPEEQAENLKRREIIMEGALGFLMLLVRQAIPCTLRFATGQQWKCLLLENEDDVRNASVEIATADFIHDNHRIDASALHDKAGAYLIYSANPDEELAEQLGMLRDKGYVSAVCPAGVQSSMLMGIDSLWELGEDFAMKNLKK